MIRCICGFCRRGNIAGIPSTKPPCGDRRSPSTNAISVSSSPRTGITAKLIDRRKREQDKCLIVCITHQVSLRNRLDRAGGRSLRVHPRFWLSPKDIFHRDFAAFQIPAASRRPWRSNRSAAPESGHVGVLRGPPGPHIEPLDRAACRGIPSARPQWQRMLDHKGLQDFDDILGLRSNSSFWIAVAGHPRYPNCVKILEN